MKKLILLLSISLLYTGFLSAEREFRPVLNGEIIRWSFLENYGRSATIGVIFSTEIVAYGDTLINNLPYKRLYLNPPFNPPFYLDPNFIYTYDEINTMWRNLVVDTSDWRWRWSRWHYKYIRESEDASRLYLYDARRDIEYLISDMNLEIGDNFRLPCGSFIVVDSVYIKNGLKHIRLDYKDIKNRSLMFIESVGATMWSMFIEESRQWERFRELNCFQNQSIFYKSDIVLFSQQCYCGFYKVYSGVNIREIPFQNYSIIVNSGEIKLSFLAEKDVQISFYDMRGVLHYTQSVFSQNIIIPTTKFSKGVYLLKIFDRNTKQTIVKRIIL